MKVLETPYPNSGGWKNVPATKDYSIYRSLSLWEWIIVGS